MTHIVLPAKNSDIDQLTASIVSLVNAAKSHVAQTVNAALVRTYWEIGRHIVEFEQGGKAKAAYGKGHLRTHRQ